MMSKVMVGIVWNEKQKDKLDILQKCVIKLDQVSEVCMFDDSTTNNAEHIKSLFMGGHTIHYIHQDTSTCKTIQEKMVVGRNAIRDYFLKSDCTHIFWLEGDILCPPNTITRLLECGKDNITGVRPQHGDIPGVFPFADNLPKYFYEKYSTPNFRLINWIWLCPSRVEEISCYGFGCNLISRRATEACEFWTKPFSPATEDILYSMDLQVQGFPTFADTGLLCAHYYSELKRPDERWDYGGDWSDLDQYRKHTIQWRNK